MQVLTKIKNPTIKFSTTQFAASHNYYSFFTYTHHFYSRKSLGFSSMWYASTSKPQETTAVLICFVVCSLCTSTAQGVSRIPVGWCVHTSNTFFLSHCVLNHFKLPARYWYLHILKSCLLVYTVALQ